MPNFLQSAANIFAPASAWLNQHIAVPPPQPTSLFQSRITHTPGGFGPMPNADTKGLYTPTNVPSQIALNARELGPEDQRKLAALWNQYNTGTVTLPPGPIDPIIMKHEQIHALQHNANLGPHANQISALVEPGITDQVRTNPIYQKEIQEFGLTPTLADEGSAIQLSQFPYASTTPQLQDAIMQHLKTSIQRKQFQKLTQRPDQSQQ